ncbi:nodulation protein NfeD [Shewanella algae]|uniref:NfeD family protein n=1 Tax=Shewanella algae TaxID=38313 RepID=UPI0030044651
MLITLDTPGGLVSSLRDINQAILGSRVPVACLVYPSGARAASAGTYILYACHIAAMASATSLGAATPVQLSPMGNEPPEPKPSENEAEKPVGDSNSQKLERKQLNDAIAYIRALAELRQRNVEWAEKAVRDAATLTASEALEANVIDYIADTPQQLLAILDGKSVAMQGGARILKTENAIVLDRSPDWRARFINLLTNPNIAYILMLLGIYGLLLEFYSPGAMLPGVVGGICLLLALYAFQLLPISYAGGGLLLLGITLLLGEAMLPSFGILGFGGLAAFVLGSVFLVDSEVEAFRIAWPVIALVSVVSLLFFLLLISFVFKAHKLSGVAGAEGMVGEYARVIDGFPGRGRVHFMGEDWQGDSEQALSPGQRVRVLGLKGLVLKLAEVKSGDIEPTENQRRGD